MHRASCQSASGRRCSRSAAAPATRAGATRRTRWHWDRCASASPGARRRTCSRGHLSALRPSCPAPGRSEEHTSELQSLMRISYAVFCLKKKKTKTYKSKEQSHTTSFNTNSSHNEQQRKKTIAIKKQ